VLIDSGSASIKAKADVNIKKTPSKTNIVLAIESTSLKHVSFSQKSVGFIKKVSRSILFHDETSTQLTLYEKKGKTKYIVSDLAIENKPEAQISMNNRLLRIQEAITFCSILKLNNLYFHEIPRIWRIARRIPTLL
jgi:hypothetical protein